MKSDEEASTSKSKKIKIRDQRLKELHKELQVTLRVSLQTLLKPYFVVVEAVKMGSTFFNAVSMIAVFWTISSVYDGTIVAKIPFIPLSFITAMSHRNLPGSDLTDGSYLFIYAVSSMAIKANLTKALGFTGPTPPAGTNPFFDMPDPDER